MTTTDYRGKFKCEQCGMETETDDLTVIGRNCSATAFEREHRMLPNECHAARTGEGYWTCDVPGGCSDCRTLAAEVEDTATLDTWNTQRKETTR